MKVLILILIICSFSVGCFAAVAVSLPVANFTGACLLDGEEYDVGTYDLPHRCTLFLCKEDGSTLHIGCPVWSEKNCEQGDFVDQSRPHPKCCQRYFHCMDEYGFTYIKKAPSDQMIH